MIDIFRVSVNATPEAMPDTLKQVEKFISALPGKPEGKPVYTKVSSLCWPMWQIEKQTEKPPERFVWDGNSSGGSVYIHREG